MASSVSAVYIHVVDDVISKVRDEFINTGAGDAVLNELQMLWEAKMMQCGVVPGNYQRPAVAKTPGQIMPVGDLNVPYEGPLEEYETPTAEMLFPPTPLQTPIQTPLPGLEHQMYQTPTPNDFTPIIESRDPADVKAGRPSPYMQPPSPWMNQRPLGVDVNVAYVEGRDEVERGASHQSLTQDFFMASSGKRKRDAFTSHYPPEGYIPQRDGASDVIVEFVLPEASGLQSISSRNGNGNGNDTPQNTSNIHVNFSSKLPQLDGSHDDYNSFPYQGVATEDYNTPGEQVELRAATPSVGTPRPAKHEVLDDDEPPLNEDDDDDDDLDDLEQGEEEPHTQHLVLAQFDKVSRTKSRWKCTLKDGIMRLNHHDILFNKANGEFDF